MSNPPHANAGGPADGDERRAFGVMQATTVRLGPDLRALLDGEAARAGVSVSQYIREAALARAAFAIAARTGRPDELLAAWARTLFHPEGTRAQHAADTIHLIAALALEDSRERREEAAALRAECRQARLQARRVRQQAGETTKELTDDAPAADTAL
jgi:hypothetical protein